MSLIAELRRRNVFRVGAAYAIVAWLLIQVADTAFPALKLPDWTLTFVTVLLILGFPLALIFAWAFELTPEGIRREQDVAPGASMRRLTGRRLDFAIIGLLALALLFLVVDHYVLEAEPESSQAVAGRAPTTSPAAREKSIAVLPFDNISPDPNDAYFADGMHDEVLTQLSKIGDLKVISRTSVMRYRGEVRPSSPEIAAALGVAHILEGSVRLAADRVRITVQLIDAKTDSHLWAETYDRELTATNIFSIQGNVARAVADALRATLSPRELEQLARVPTESLDAYEAYLLAKQRMERRTSDALAQAADGFRRAIGLDARFALAYVGLVEIYVLQLEYSGQSVGDVLPKATAAIDRALDLDPDLGEAYNALGAIRYALLDFEGAERAYRRALELQPNYALTYHWYAFLLRDHLARCDEALRLHQKALELDPLSPIFIVNLGMDLSCLGEFDEALGRFERTIQMDPEFALGYWAIGWHHATVLGQLDEAVRWYRKGISLDQGNDQAAVALGALYLHLGAIEQSKRWIQRSIEIKPDSPFANLRMSEIALGDGDEAGALEHARRALAAEPDWSLALARLRDLELRAGNPERARALYERANPELLDASDPKVERRNYKQAIDLAFVLLEMGERERAQRLLERARRQIQQVPRLGLPWGFGIADVRIYAMQGDVQRALASLRQAVDEGWRTDWRYELALDPSLASLHDEPEFKAIVAELEADMAEQRARVEEMERRGELIFPTE